MHKIQLEPKVLKALLVIAPKNDCRHFLNGIALKGGFLMAADGKMAARIKTCSGAGHSEIPESALPAVILPTHAVEQAVKMYAQIPKHSKAELYLSYDYQTHNCRFECVGKEGNKYFDTEFTAINGEYPDELTRLFEMANKDGDKSIYSYLNAQYLALFIKMQKAVDIKNPAIKIIMNGRNAAYTEIKSGFGMLEILLMPMSFPVNETD